MNIRIASTPRPPKAITFCRRCFAAAAVATRFCCALLPDRLPHRLEASEPVSAAATPDDAPSGVVPGTATGRLKANAATVRVA